MSRLFDDTTPEAEEVMVRLLRDMPAARKLELVCQLSANVRQLAIAGLRDRHPSASDEEIRRRLADLLLGKELASEVYGPLPPGSEPTYLGAGPLPDD